jgi:hypothetical protein
MLKRRFFFTATLAAAILGFLPGAAAPAVAQENQASFKINLFSAEGFVVSDIYSIDAEYGQTNQIEVPAPFRFKIPRRDGITPFFETGVPGGMLIKVHFTTGDRETAEQDRTYLENLQFIGMTLPLVEPEERINILARMLANEAFDNVTANYEQKEFIGARMAKLGEMDVVEVLGKYIDPELGLMYARIIGMPNPDAEQSIFVVANIVADRFELQSPNDLALTSTGKAIASFEYLSE